MIEAKETSLSDFIQDKSVFEQIYTYQTNRPFPHIVIDDFLKPEIAEALYSVFPSHESNFWYEYANPIERKLASNQIENFLPEILHFFEIINSNNFMKQLEKITGIERIIADPNLHGGGMHCIKRGGKLDIHIDYALHPTLKLQRRLNLIVYLNKEWQEEWGGHLELWDAKVENRIQKITPKFNRAVLFNTDDTSFHGHPDPLNCPTNTARKSLAVYYLSEPQADVADRWRARFVAARPQDPKDEETETLRIKRSGLTTGSELWKTEKL